MNSYTDLLESANHDEWIEERAGSQIFEESEIMDIKLIDAGWGSSGYYSKEVLERDRGVFPAGTHMYINHPSQKEYTDRPERDVRNLAAVTVEGAEWLENGKDGPGLYAKAEVFSSHALFLKERANHIGVSIVADGMREIGEAEGRKGNIIKSLDRGRSVDFVTRAGRGGKLLAESDDSEFFNEVIILGGDQEMEPKEEATAPPIEETAPAPTPDLDRLVAEVAQLKQEAAALKAELMQKEADRIVHEALAGYGLPESINKLIKAQAANALPLSESDKLDAAGLLATVNSLAEAIKADMPKPQRSIVTDGGGAVKGQVNSLEKINEKSVSLLMSEGYTEEAARVAVGVN